MGFRSEPEETEGALAPGAFSKGAVMETKAWQRFYIDGRLIYGGTWPQTNPPNPPPRTPLPTLVGSGVPFFGWFGQGR